MSNTIAKLLTCENEIVRNLAKYWHDIKFPIEESQFYRHNFERDNYFDRLYFLFHKKIFYLEIKPKDPEFFYTNISRGIAVMPSHLPDEKAELGNWPRDVKYFILSRDSIEPLEITDTLENFIKNPSKPLETQRLDGLDITENVVKKTVFIPMRNLYTVEFQNYLKEKKCWKNI